ncbi:MAG: 50S ribosomal protein L25 [Clostridiaceae bacterium]|nr:50S ribosomal protein L25 [Clostridiaceae bacterium]
MEEIILKTVLRTDKPKKVRQAGFIPGVLNASDTTSTAVQFDASELNKIVSRHGSNARVWISIGRTKKKFGYIKDIQRHPVDKQIIHVSIQLVSVDQPVTMQIPISFHGQEELKHNRLHLQVIKGDVGVTGKAATMPDVIVTDVSAKKDGDSITRADFSFTDDIEVNDNEDEIYALIKAVREKAQEPEAEEAPKESEAITEAAKAESEKETKETT